MDSHREAASSSSSETIAATIQNEPGDEERDVRRQHPVLTARPSVAGAGPSSREPPARAKRVTIASPPAAVMIQGDHEPFHAAPQPRCPRRPIRL